MNYYVINDEGVYPALAVAQEPELLGGPWYEGIPISIPLPAVLQYELVEEDEAVYHIKNLYDAEAFPLMSKTLARILAGLGVNNIEYFPAQLLNRNNQQLLDTHVAFNVLGLVAAADEATSTTFFEDQPIGLIDTDFASLTLDPSKAHGLDLFRLAENCSAIIVSDRVKEAIEAAALPGFVFYGPGEWSG